MDGGKVHASIPEESADLKKTAELFSQLDWTSFNQAVANFFMGHHTIATEAKTIEGYLDLMFGMKYVDDYAFEKNLAALVKAKVLRKYRKQGKTLFEVNY